MTRVWLALFVLAASVALAQPASKKRGPTAEQTMMSRPLSVADIDLYCKIAAEIRKLTGPVRSGEDSDRMFELTRTTAPKHGLSHAEYRALDLRISSALLALDAGKTGSLPAKSKADCELVSKHRARIDEARRFAK